MVVQKYVMHFENVHLEFVFVKQFNSQQLDDKQVHQKDYGALELARKPQHVLSILCFQNGFQSVQFLPFLGISQSIEFHLNHLGAW